MKACRYSTVVQKCMLNLACQSLQLTYLHDEKSAEEPCDASKLLGDNLIT